MPLPPLADPESLTERAVATARALPVVSFLGTTLLAFNGVQTASLALLPLSRRRFRAFNRWAADLWWGWCVEISRRLNHVQLVLTGDVVPPRENAVVVANHQQMPDITFLMDFARTKERLGDLKWFVKDPIKYVPGVGWGMLFLDCVFIKRRWTDDENTVARVFARIKRDRVPLWLVSFVEGTRLTPRSLAGSQGYAAERGLPPPRHVLVPRTKGFVATVQALRRHVDAVYDVTIGYKEGVPTLWQFIRGQAPRAHLHVRRYPVDRLPVADDELARWLMERFVEKDALLERFYDVGSFA